MDWTQLGDLFGGMGLEGGGNIGDNVELPSDLPAPGEGGSATISDPNPNWSVDENGNVLDENGNSTGMTLDENGNLIDPSAGGGGGGTLARILQGLGLNSPLGLMQLLGPLAGGLLGHSAATHATDQMVGAMNNANAAVRQILGGAMGNFAPYQQAGQGALGNLGAYHFNPITTQPAVGGHVPSPITTQPAVGGQVMAPIGNWGPRSLAQIMRGY